MMLADMGAEVVRVDRAGGGRGRPAPPRRRPRPGPPLGRRRPQAPRRRRGRAAPGRAGRRADRGVPARGDGAPRPRPRRLPGPQPPARLRPHDRLGPGRPLRRMAGHDINYIALGGRAGPHRPGRARRRCRRSTWSATSAAAACCWPSAWSAACSRPQRSGQGQVVDAAMVDGAALLMADVHGHAGHGRLGRRAGHQPARHRRPLLRRLRDGRRPATSRSGSIEPQFYAELLRADRPGSEADLPAQMDRTAWPAMKERLAALFKHQDPRRVVPVMEGTDVCFAPVLSIAEARRHPHNGPGAPSSRWPASSSRRRRPASAARRPRSPARRRGPAQHTDDVLADWGFAADEIAKLRASGAVA